MGRWSRAEYDRVLVAKLEHLYQKCRDPLLHPRMDDRFRTFVRQLDPTDKAVQACFMNLMQHVHHKQVATSSSVTADHPIFRPPVLASVPPFRMNEIEHFSENISFPHVGDEAHEGARRSPTPMFSRMPEDSDWQPVFAPWERTELPQHDPNEVWRPPPSRHQFAPTLPSYVSPPSPTLSQSAAAREERAGSTSPPMSPSRAWLEEYQFHAPTQDSIDFAHYAYSFSHPIAPLPRRRRADDEEEDTAPPRRRRRVEPYDLSAATRMERDTRRDGIVFPSISPEVEQSAEAGAEVVGTIV